MKCVTLSVLSFGLPAMAESTPEAFPGKREGASVKAFVPRGWVLEQQVKGDLNGDGIADVVLVLREKNKKNIRRSEDCTSCGPVDENLRKLVVIFASAERKNYRLATQEWVGLPTPSADNPHVEDPYSGIEIRKGILEIRTGFFASMGTWFSSHKSFKFRYQENCFRLIGEESSEVMRNNLETMKSTSINYLTGKMKVETGNDKSKTIWSSFLQEELRCIEQIDFEPPH